MSPTSKILQGHCLDKLAELADGSVHCVVTSPPYWGLRDYKIPPVHWPEVTFSPMARLAEMTIPEQEAVHGLEPDLWAYVAHEVAVFREVRRVLRDDGVLFLNLGDSYFGGGGYCPDAPSHTAGCVQRVVSCGTSGKAPANSQQNDCVCRSLCDVCREVYHRISHTDPLLVSMLRASLHAPSRECKATSICRHPTSDCSDPEVRKPCANRDQIDSECHGGERLHAFLASMLGESNQQLLGECLQRDNSSECLLCGRSIERSAQAFECKTVDQSEPARSDAEHRGLPSHTSYSGETDGGSVSRKEGTTFDSCAYQYSTIPSRQCQLKPKDLIGIPWRVAFALQADGWFLRSDIIWNKCLSGGAWVYARTQKGEMPSTVKDLVRLDPSTVQLWNGREWCQVRSWTQTPRPDNPIEIVLRSGERIGCTAEHRWPTNRGLVEARGLRVGDVIESCTLPEPLCPVPAYMNYDLAWFIGLFLAEGSWADDTIQLALNADEEKWIPKIANATAYLGGSYTYSINGNGLNVRVYGKMLVGLLNEYLNGRTQKTRHLTNSAWRLPNKYLAAIVSGYLDGDGHQTDGRWRLGFTRNYALERDLRIAAARLGAVVTIKPCVATCTTTGKEHPSFRGEWRWNHGDHPACKERSEIVEIRESRARKFWDIAVEGEPHLFALASGVLTHNSNPMPESVTDRPTKSHEYLFLLSKQQKYFYDSEAIKEPSKNPQDDIRRMKQARNGATEKPGNKSTVNRLDAWTGEIPDTPYVGRNKRSVFSVDAKLFKMRDDLTMEIKQKVVTELLRRGII